MNESEYRDLRGKFVLFEWHIHYLFEGRLVSPRGKRIREMEQQVEVLKLEKDLAHARRVLGAMRRAGYHATEEDGPLL